MIVGYVGVGYSSPVCPHMFHVRPVVPIVSPSCLIDFALSLENGFCNSVCFDRALVIKFGRCYARGDVDGKLLGLFLPSCPVLVDLGWFEASSDALDSSPSYATPWSALLLYWAPRYLICALAYPIPELFS